ncbi:2-hydroxyisoflavanone dehydratase-like [Coffea arabica]|uniref:2-hydroxyisoflavanone dehydratase-like n=1 Tax=Coffea arabica TaxID=13443 RepID=A0A6P6WLY9_COFAR
MASDSKEVATDLSPLLKVYEDGRVERFFGSPYVPPSPEDPSTSVSSKDITISADFSARLYLPNVQDSSKKFPILVYFHCGGFCTESAFSILHHRYLNLLVSEANALAVSVEYRLAPECPLPAAYEDCWAALQWISSHVVVNSNTDKEHWLLSHGNFDEVYIGGDSSGANIVHNIAMRAGVESLDGDVKILGGFLSHPFFWDPEINAENVEETMLYRVWRLVYPAPPGGLDNPMINPLADDSPSLSQLGCSRLFVCTSEKDELRERTGLYVQTLTESGWKGEVELVEIEGEDHCFHIFHLESEKAKSLVKRLAFFINNNN